MRKILAVICTLITLFVLKETFNVFITDEHDIVKQRSIFIVIGLSISIPLIILSFWLWSPGRKNNESSDITNQ